LSEAAALRLQLRASRLMAAAIVSLHLGAAACLTAVMPGAAGALAAGLVLLLGATSAWDRALLRGRSSVRALELRADASAVFTLANGRRLDGRVATRRNVNRWWVTLPLRGATSRTVVVVRDMLPADEYRRLRMWALWGRAAPARAPAP
jgi:hypothetical protein